MERQGDMVVHHRACHHVGFPVWVYPLYTCYTVLSIGNRSVHPIPAGIKMEIKDPQKFAEYITIMHQNPNILVRIQDNGAIDVMFSETQRLEPAIESVKCPYCDIHVREHQQPLEDTIRGMYLRCPECGQRFFIHLFVPFGGTPS